MSHKLSLSNPMQQLDSIKANTSKDSSDVLVILDSKISASESLVAGIAAEHHIAVLDQTRDGVAQITALLQQHRHLSQIHIISHGAPGCLYLGNGELSLSTLDAQSAQLSRWFSQDDAPSLLLYGCNVAAGDAGSEFLEKLHALTGAAIAASKTRTGNADQGGDWNLEVTLGNPVVELAIAPEVQATYAGVFAPLNQADYDALRDLYQNTGGANWTNNTGWVDHDFSSNTPPESSVVEGWFGITVANDRVTEIILGDNQLTGGIPTSLGNLANLERLQLNNNQLSGPIPTELGQLIGLSRLDLTSNQLTGEIPASLGNLVNLGLLQLAFNTLTGEIPASLGNLTALTVLGLSDNDLTGSIPAELAQLSNITTFRLTKNQLSGEVPQSITDFLTQRANESDNPTVQITIDNPLFFATEFTDQTVIQNSAAVSIPVAVGDIDQLDNAVASALSFTAASSDQNIATVAVVGDPGSQSIQITPVQGATGAVEITLVLTDGTDDGGQSGNAAFADFNRIEKFQFSIVDASEAPQITTNTLTIEEGATIPFTSDFLAAVDSNTGDENLTFTVSTVTGGQFELVSAAGSAITSFTQQQVKDNAIQFVHDGGEVAPTYNVSVSDGVVAATTPAAVSNVTFTNVNDAPTFVLENGVSQISGSANTAQGIKVADIAVTDPDGGGTLEYSLTGINADLFEVANPTSATPSLQIKPGVSITPNTTYNVTVNLDDPQIGGPGLVEATQTFQLDVGDAVPPVPDDFNGDRSSDIVFRNTTTGENRLVLTDLSNPTTPTVASFGPFIQDARWAIQGVGNFDGKNSADIVWRNTATGQNVLWLGGSAQGTTASVGSAVALKSVTDKNWTIKGTGDFNGDSLSDILWYNGETKKISVWYTNSDPAQLGSPNAVELTVGDISSLTLEATGDFDNNGSYDLLFSDAAGALSIQFMNGANTTGDRVAVTDGQNPLSKTTGLDIIGTGSLEALGSTTPLIAFRSADGSNSEAWTMNGAVRTSSNALPGQGTVLTPFDAAWQAIL